MNANLTQYQILHKQRTVQVECVRKEMVRFWWDHVHWLPHNYFTIKRWNCVELKRGFDWEACQRCLCSTTDFLVEVDTDLRHLKAAHGGTRRQQKTKPRGKNFPGWTCVKWKLVDECISSVSGALMITIAHRQLYHNHFEKENNCVPNYLVSYHLIPLVTMNED